MSIRGVGFILVLFMSIMSSLLMLSLVTEARSGDMFETREVFMTVKNYTPNSHSPFMTDGSTLNKGLNLTIQTDFLKYLYSKNVVWSLADQHQFRWIGWNYNLGARILPFLEVEYEHFSKHILDKEYPYKNQGRFPVEDSVNVNFYFYRRDKGASIF